MNDAIAGFDIRNGDNCIVDLDDAVDDAKGDSCALQRGCRQTVAYVSRHHLAGDDVVEQNLREVTRRVGQECVQRILRNLGEGIIRGCKNGEGAVTAQRIHQAGSRSRGHQRTEVGVGDGNVHDGAGRLAGRARGGQCGRGFGHALGHNFRRNDFCCFGHDFGLGNGCGFGHNLGLGNNRGHGYDFRFGRGRGFGQRCGRSQGVGGGRFGLCGGLRLDNRRRQKYGVDHMDDAIERAYISGGYQRAIDGNTVIPNLHVKFVAPHRGHHHALGDSARLDDARHHMVEKDLGECIRVRKQCIERTRGQVGKCIVSRGENCIGAAVGQFIGKAGGLRRCQECA